MLRDGRIPEVLVSAHPELRRTRIHKCVQPCGKVCDLWTVHGVLSVGLWRVIRVRVGETGGSMENPRPPAVSMDPGYWIPGAPGVTRLLRRPVSEVCVACACAGLSTPTTPRGIVSCVGTSSACALPRSLPRRDELRWLRQAPAAPAHSLSAAGVVLLGFDRPRGRKVTSGRSFHS